MKKLVLSIAIISAITVGVGAVASAAETNEEGLDNGNSISTEIQANDEDNNYWGNPNCPYYGENNNGENGKSGEGNRYGYNSGNQYRGRCGGSGNGMMRNRGN